MKFLQTLIENDDTDIFDDLLDDLGMQEIMSDVVSARHKGVPWDKIAAGKETYAEDVDVTQKEWDAMIRVLKAGGRYAKMVGLDEGKKFGPPKTTAENPLVDVWEDSESKDYPAQGIIGHMHLTTAQNIHRFNMSGLAKKLRKAGFGKRVKAVGDYGTVYLEWSKHNAKHMKESNNGKLNESRSDLADVETAIRQAIDLKARREGISTGEAAASIKEELRYMLETL